PSDVKAGRSTPATSASSHAIILTKVSPSGIVCVNVGDVGDIHTRRHDRDDRDPGTAPLERDRRPTRPGRAPVPSLFRGPLPFRRARGGLRRKKMSQAARYRSYEQFEREELFRPQGFVQTLDEFHDELIVEEGDIVDLFDRVEEDEDEDDDEE